MWRGKEEKWNGFQVAIQFLFVREFIHFCVFQSATGERFQGITSTLPYWLFRKINVSVGNTQLI